MKNKIGIKRLHLSLVAEQTRKMLFMLLAATSIILFICHLFLMNQLAMRGYILSKESTQNTTLKRELEQSDARVAQLQTHAFVGKSSATKLMVARERQNFVVIPSKMTAQK